MLRAGWMLFAVLIFFSCKNEIKSIENKKNNVIHVSPKDSLPPSTARIYLTFDDGPYLTTPELMDRLKSLNIKSSFFIVGSQVAYSSYYDSIFRITKNIPLFKVYNHTYTHAVTNGRIYQYYNSPVKVVEDIKRNKEVINTGGNITRLPGKNTWRVGNKIIRTDRKTKKVIELIDSAQMNENIIGWDVEWSLKHSKYRNEVDTLFHQIKSLLEKDTSNIKHVVVLSHDYLYKNNESLENLSYLVNRLKSELLCSFHWVEELEGLIPQTK